jgi:hypothetical protein
MRRLVLLGLIGALLLGASPAAAAWAEVASRRAKGTGNNVDSAGVAFPGNVTSGNLLIAAGALYGSADATIVVTDTVGTTYTVVSFNTTTVVNTFIAWGVAAASGANTVTVNPTGAGDYFQWEIDEFSGAHATPFSVDGSFTDEVGASTAVTDALTTLVDNELIIGVMTFQDAATYTMTPGGAYTQFGEDEDNATIVAFNAVFRIGTTAQAYTVDWTLGTADAWLAQTMSFKPAVGGGPAPVSRALLLGVGP